MQDIYNHIPETNLVSRAYSVAAVVYSQFLLHVTLFRPRRIFCTYTLALSVVRVPCPLPLFFVVLNFMLSCYVAQVFSG